MNALVYTYVQSSSDSMAAPCFLLLFCLFVNLYSLEALIHSHRNCCKSSMSIFLCSMKTTFAVSRLFMLIICPLETAVITTDPKNILLRHFYQQSESKVRQKRAAPDNLARHNDKQPRGPFANGGSLASTRSWGSELVVLLISSALQCPLLPHATLQPSCHKRCQSLI